MDVAIMFDGEMGRENREGISLVCSSVVFFFFLSSHYFYFLNFISLLHFLATGYSRVPLPEKAQE